MKGKVVYHLKFGWGTIISYSKDSYVVIKFDQHENERQMDLKAVMNSASPELFFEEIEVHKKLFCSINKIAESRYFGDFLWSRAMEQGANEKKRLINLTRLQSRPKRPNYSKAKTSTKSTPAKDTVQPILPKEIPVNSPPPSPPQLLFFQPINTSPKPNTQKPAPAFSKPQKTIDSADLLLEKLKSFGFEGFLHTTELGNFRTIVSEGQLKARTRLDAQQLPYIDRADQAVIEHTKETVKAHCRFYYYFQTPTNYRAGYKHPVILVFTPKMIRWENVKFSYGNAGSNYNTIAESVEEALNFDWEAIFERGYHSRSKLSDPAMITLLRNAEFLVRTSVRIKYIDKVYFKYPKDMEEAKTFCAPDLIAKFVLDERKF